MKNKQLQSKLKRLNKYNKRKNNCNTMTTKL